MESIWSEKWPRIPADEKELPEKAEVVIVGGGMSGLLCAYLLKEAGVQAIVLEADHVCSGQTKNTTAKITSQHGLIYENLRRIFGEEVSIQYAKMNEKAIDEYERIVIKNKIDCDFVRVPSYLYTKTKHGEELLRQEHDAAKKSGIFTSLVSETTLPFAVRLALKYERQAQFHPLKFLARIVPELEIFEKTRVIRIKGKNVVTERGTIEAERIILATHFPFVNVPGFYFARMHQERSYVLAVGASEKGQNVGLDGMYYGIDSDGLSFREAEGRILLSGKSERTGVVQKENPYDALRREAKRLWPDSTECACWAAQDCMTLDHLPYIGRFSTMHPEWYVATGFEKWGMTNSMIAAMALCDHITGQNIKKWQYVSPQRPLTKKAVGTLMQESAFTAGNFLIWRKPRCPHLGCRLIWNPHERSWDCPCHGSRFSEHGELVDNPAQTGL